MFYVLSSIKLFLFIVVIYVFKLILIIFVYLWFYNINGIIGMIWKIERVLLIIVKINFLRFYKYIVICVI